MTSEIRAAVAMLKAKVQAIGEHFDGQNRDHYLFYLPQYWDRFEKNPPTMQQLRGFDDPLETTLRRSLPKETQEKIRAKLFAEFGRSTVGDMFEVVAKRILERGEVANDEEAESCESFVNTMPDYGWEVLGYADASRLGLLLADYRRR